MSKNKYTVTIEGFSSKAEAKAFVDWYSGSGEQDSSIWFEERKNEGIIEHSNMNVDCSKTWDNTKKFPSQLLNETDTNVTMVLKLYK